MRHTIKKIFTVVVTILVIIILSNYLIFPSLFGTGIIGVYDRHIGRRPHITGQITCSIYGKEYKLSDDDATLYFIGSNGMKKEDMLKLIDGNFKRSDGQYGENIFILKLSKEFCIQNIISSINNGLVIKFGYLTAPNWYKDNTKLEIYIEKTQDDKTSNVIRLVQTVTGDDFGSKEESYILEPPFENKTEFEIHQSFI